jgi:hypothetical protein
MNRPRDLPFEALALVTSTDWDAGRGELNAALKIIRPQFDGTDQELATEIHERAKLYRKVFQGASLTPPALAKHWLRVFEESVKQRDQQATNQSAPSRNCVTCSGHRFVLVSTRPMEETRRMREFGQKPRGEIEEYAPCPSCHEGCDVSFRRHDGTMFRGLDAAKVAEMIRR